MPEKNQPGLRQTLPLWLAGLFYLFATEDGKRYRPIGWMFIIPFVLFVIGRGRGYYMAPAYPMLLAAGAVWVERWVASLSSRRSLVIRRTTWMALAIGALVDAAIVLPIAPPGSLWWRFADKAHGGDFNEEIGWPELVQTITIIRDSLPVEERSRLGILAGDSGQAGAINLYGPALRLPRAICGMNSHWLRGYGDPPPETVIVVLRRASCSSCCIKAKVAQRGLPDLLADFEPARGETGDGRSVSNDAQDHSDHSNKADQVAPIDDKGPGEEKGLADSLPGREQQADLGITLSPATIQSDLNDIETLEVSPGKQLQPNHVMTVDLRTTHSDLDDIVSTGLKAGQNLQTSSGKPSDPSMTHSDLGSIVSFGLPSNQMLQTDRGMILTSETIDLDSDDIMTKASRVSFMLNLSRGKSLSPSRRNHLDFGLPDIDDAPVIVRDSWALGADRAKVLPPSNPAVEDDEDGWRLVPYFGAALCFFSWIGQKGLSIIKRKETRLKFEPNAVRSIAFPANAVHAEETDESSDKNFNGTGLS